MMRQAVHLGKFTRIKIGNKEVVDVPILQFADDTIFLCEASMQNVLVIKSILRCFELVVGLNVNFNKSKLARIYCETTRTHRYASPLHCHIMTTPFTYLGLPMG